MDEISEVNEVSKVEIDEKLKEKKNKALQVKRSQGKTYFLLSQ